VEASQGTTTEGNGVQPKLMHIVTRAVLFEMRHDHVAFAGSIVYQRHCCCLSNSTLVCLRKLSAET
jgi:hypothetical protein